MPQPTSCYEASKAVLARVDALNSPENLYRHIVSAAAYDLHWRSQKLLSRIKQLEDGESPPMIAWYLRRDAEGVADLFDSILTVLEKLAALDAEDAATADAEEAA